MAKRKYPNVDATINGETVSFVGEEALAFINALGRASEAGHAGVFFHNPANKTNDYKDFVSFNCLCQVKVTGETEVDTTDPTCDPMECIPFDTSK